MRANNPGWPDTNTGTPIRKKRGLLPIGVQSVSVAKSKYWLSLLCLLVFTALTSSIQAQSLTNDEVKTLVENNAPIFHFHPDEPYLPSSAEWFLQRATLYERNFSVPDGSSDRIVAEGGLDTDFPAEALITDPEDFLSLIELSVDPTEVGQEQAEANLKRQNAYYLEAPPSHWPGDLSSARTYVNVYQTKDDPETPNDDHINWDDFIGINYWLYYPYNGPGTMRTDILSDELIDMDPNGIHSGDWERVTFVIRKADQVLEYAIFEAHGDAQLIDAADLDRDADGRINVYASYRGHGFYPKTGDNADVVLPKIFGKSFRVELLNLSAKGGVTLDGRSKNEIISIEMPGSEPIAKPVWLDYPYRWGQSVLLMPDRSLGERIARKVIFGDELGGDVLWLGDKISVIIADPIKLLNADIKRIGWDRDDIPDQTFVPDWDNLDLVEYITTSFNFLAQRDTLESQGPPGPQNKPSFRGEGQDFITHEQSDGLLVTGIRGIYNALNMEIKNDRYLATDDDITLNLSAEGNIWTAGDQEAIYAKMAFSGTSIDRFTDIVATIELIPTELQKLMAQVKIESDDDFANQLGSDTEKLLKGIGIFVDEIARVKSVKFTGTAKQFYDGNATMTAELLPFAGIRTYIDQQISSSSVVDVNAFNDKINALSIPSPDQTVSFTTTGIDIRESAETTAYLYGEIKKAVQPYAGIFDDVATIVSEIVNIIEEPIDEIIDLAAITANTTVDAYWQAEGLANSFVTGTRSLYEDAICFFKKCPSKPPPYTPPQGTYPVSLLVNQDVQSNTILYGLEKDRPVGTISTADNRSYWGIFPKDDEYFLIKSIEGHGYLSSVTNEENGTVELFDPPTARSLWRVQKTDTGFFLRNKIAGKSLRADGRRGLRLKSRGGAGAGQGFVWKGKYADYMTTKDIVSGKAKAVAKLYDNFDRTGTTGLIRDKFYSKADFGSIFPLESLSALFIYDDTKQLTLYHTDNRYQTHKDANRAISLPAYDFNDLTNSVRVENKTNASVITPGNYFITANFTQKVLGVAGSSKNILGNIQQEANAGKTSQQWVIEPKSDNQYKIRNINSGHYLTAAGQRLRDRLNVHQQPDNPAANNQRWLFSDQGDGYFKIVSAANPGFVLAVAFGNLQLNYIAAGEDSQKFKLTSASPELPTAFFDFKSKVTNLYLSNRDNLDHLGYIVQTNALTNGAKWGFVKSPDGYYFIMSKLSGTLDDFNSRRYGYMSSLGANSSQLASVRQTQSATQNYGVDHAEWTIETAGANQYRFKNRRTGRYIATYGETAVNSGLRLSDQPRDGAIWLSTGSLTGVDVVPAPGSDKRVASQSSTSAQFGGDAMRAADGNTNGNFHGNSVTHTETENMPWWQLDLGVESTIANIEIHNRTDCCSDRLSWAKVFVSKTQFPSANVAATQSDPNVTTYTLGFMGNKPTHLIEVNKPGRYVRVQLQSGSLPLSLAEVIVRVPGSL